MIAYFSIILDHTGKEVMSLEWTTSAKHSAFLAKQFVDNCPPAANFKITKRFIDRSVVVSMLNSKNY
jgi:hypothetical protein